MASAADIAKELESVIGKNDAEATVSMFLDTGFPPLNHSSSADWTGGFPVGRMIEIAGPPSSGKTAISTACMKAAQQAGGLAGFNDHERSFSMILARKMGLKTEAPHLIYKTPRTFEESITIASVAAKTIREKKLIDKKAPIVWVFDSLAAMVPQSALLDAKGKDRSAEDRNMNDNTALARATSAHFPAFAQHCEEYDMLAIFLNQLRLKIGVVFGDPRKTTGGSAPEFYFSQRLWLSASQIKKGTDIVGQEVTGKFMKNKIARPFMTASWRFMYQPDGTGKFDVERSMVEFLVSEGIIPAGSKAGSIVWNGKQTSPEQLARDIESRGAMAELTKLLPKAYQPEVVAEVTPDDDPAEAA